MLCPEIEVGMGSSSKDEETRTRIEQQQKGSEDYEGETSGSKDEKRSGDSEDDMRQERRRKIHKNSTMSKCMTSQISYLNALT